MLSLEHIPILSELSPFLQDVVARLLLLVLALIFIAFLRGALTRLLLIPMRRIVKRTSNIVDDMLYEAVRRPVRLITFAVTIVVLVAIFEVDESVQVFSSHVARSLIIAAVMLILYNIADAVTLTSQTLERVMGIHVQPRLLPFMRVVLQIFILLMGAFIIIQEFGYDISALIASFGVVGIAIGLAAQDTAANIIGFTMIVSDNPFQVNDYVVQGDVAGTVEHVGIRSTRIRKLDQSLVTVPNRILADNALTNWSRLTKRRLDFYIGMTYDSSRKQMQTLVDQIRSMLKSTDDVDPDSVVVNFVEFGDSALSIRIICYVLLSDWNAYTSRTEDINMNIMEIVENLGMSMAFPSTSLYVESMPETDDLAARPRLTYIPVSDEDGSSPSETPQQANESASND
ncbi:MAG: mechanosensitive ion channel family protein [Aggregatilineales bacterium]